MLLCLLSIYILDCPTTKTWGWEFSSRTISSTEVQNAQCLPSLFQDRIKIWSCSTQNHWELCLSLVDIIPAVRERAPLCGNHVKTASKVHLCSDGWIHLLSSFFWDCSKHPRDSSIWAAEFNLRQHWMRKYLSPLHPVPEVLTMSNISPA